MTIQGDASRKRVLDYILGQTPEDKEKCGPNFTDISKALEIDVTSVARIVKELKGTGQIDHISNGKQHWYSLPQAEVPEEEPVVVPRKPREKYTAEDAAQAKDLSAQFTKALSNKDYPGMTKILEGDFQDLPLRKKKSVLGIAFTLAQMNGDEEAILLLQEADREYKTNLRVR